MRMCIIFVLIIGSIFITSCSFSDWQLAEDKTGVVKHSRYQTINTVFISQEITRDDGSAVYLVCRKPNGKGYAEVPIGSIFTAKVARSFGSYNNGYFPMVYGALTYPDGSIRANTDFTDILNHWHFRRTDKYYRNKNPEIYIKQLNP